MFSYLIDYDLKLSLPRPEIDGPLLFEQIETSRDSLAAYLPWVAMTLTADDEINFLNTTLKLFGARTALHLTIYQADAPVGMISLNTIDTLVRHKADIGYWLTIPERGKGIMHKSIEALADIAFHDYDLNKLTINAAVANRASNAVAEKAGFHLDGTLRQDDQRADGTFLDVNTYSLLRSEWA
ncbi:GNAT family protein [Lacticaseibacillus paracasei]|uniref:GNAT family N-acetyltransferase n=1 Tax=Lacticaseibacillus paracasei TaxID=1597 RepID=UPI002ADEB153|nr:GNAT family protein [Lacticaseibacillus paracasei]MEA0974179.1 GNAT family protein [Lacticaseibacillus paracasei]